MKLLKLVDVVRRFLICNATNLLSIKLPSDVLWRPYDPVSVEIICGIKVLDLCRVLVVLSVTTVMDVSCEGVFGGGNNFDVNLVP